MAKRKTTKRPGLGGGPLNPASYGIHGFPDFDPAHLPGDDVREKARAYVEALDLDPDPAKRPGLLLWRVECLIEDHERARAGLPSVEEELMARMHDGREDARA